MEYKNAVKELREKVPVSIMKAIELLKKNGGNISISEQEFKNESITEIRSQTKVDKDTAKRHYEACKYDIAKTITSILNEIYDRNYICPDFLTKKKLDIISTWLKFEETEIFEVALSYPQINIVIDTLILLDNLSQTGNALKNAKAVFDTYAISETMDAQTYVKTIDKLRENKDYTMHQKLFEQNKYKIEEELEKHYRNIDK